MRETIHTFEGIGRLQKYCAGLICLQIVVCSADIYAQDARPRLLFIPLAQDENDHSDEETFLTTLRLNLDRYEMARVSMDRSGFEEMPTQYKVDHLYPLIRQNHAQGAMWLSRGINEVLTLHVITMEADRAIIRLFRQQQGVDAPRELAQTVAELFESAYLLELEETDDEKMSCPPPVEVPVEHTPAPPPQHEVRPHLYISGTVMGALAGHVGGPAIQVALSSGVLLDIAKNLGLRLGVGGGLGPYGEENGYAIDGWSVFGELEFLLRLVDTGFQWGPAVGISGGLQSIRVKEGGLAASYRYPKADATFGFNFSIPVNRVRTDIGLGLFLSPYRTEVTARNDDNVVYRNQAFGWFLSNEWYFF
jgi:hypothetical protein